MEPTVVSGNGTETGQIIVTTLSGRKGKKKQVNVIFFIFRCDGL